MPKTRMLHQFGVGTSIRTEDYTKAAERAIKDALWHNSISLAPAFGKERSEMIVDVEVAVQRPESVETDRLLEVFPYGKISISAVAGGLDVPKPGQSGVTIMANAVVIVSLDLEGVA